jgi:hypothetical protein
VERSRGSGRFCPSSWRVLAGCRGSGREGGGHRSHCSRRSDGVVPTAPDARGVSFTAALSWGNDSGPVACRSRADGAAVPRRCRRTDLAYWWPTSVALHGCERTRRCNADRGGDCGMSRSPAAAFTARPVPPDPRRDRCSGPGLSPLGPVLTSAPARYRGEASIDRRSEGRQRTHDSHSEKTICVRSVVERGVRRRHAETCTHLALGVTP